MDEGRTFPLPAAQGRTWEDQASSRRGAPVNGGRTTFLTIVTGDRVAQSRIFARSARECHPDARLAVLVLGDDLPSRMLDDLYDLVIPVEQLSLAGLADMRFRYSIAELCFALKPWVMQHLAERFANEPVYYFDSDIELFTPLVEVAAALAHGANLVLTPHIIGPGPDQDRERALLRSGSFNAGFLAMAPSAAARAFVAWWCERVRTGGTHDVLEGTYGDQKWLELAPAICDGVTVLRHPGYNFAYWNAHERPLNCMGGMWTAAGWPLRFVHYSQWNLRKQDSEEYLAGYFAREYQPFAGLFAEYQNKVRQETASCGGGEPAAADEQVAEVVRNAYARHGPAVDGDPSQVLAHAVAVLNAPSRTGADLPDLPLTILYDEIWRHHADLRYRFDIDRADGRLAYLHWLAGTGTAELGIPAAFLGPARSALDRERIRQLEAADGEVAPAPGVPGVIGPLATEPPAPADTVAAMLAARDAERERVHAQQDDIRLLAIANKALRRDLQTLRVRHWRDRETIEALEQELGQAREAHDGALRRGRALVEQVADLRARPWQLLADRLTGRTPPANSPGRRLLAGDGPFFQRGFRLGDTVATVGTSVRRHRRAPSGIAVFGPYVELAAGTYAVTIDARLYRPLPVSAGFKLDIVRHSGQQAIAAREFRLRAMARWRRCQLVFTLKEADAAPDFEFRIWAGEGTSLEIGEIDLYQLSDELSPAEAAG